MESPLTPDERAELGRLEAEFAAFGGRGVDIADRIDALRAKAGNIMCDNCGDYGPSLSTVAGRFCDEACEDAYGLA